MGAVRWTGKGLKLLGQILEAEEIEAWLEEKGRAFVEDTLTKLPVKWLGGRYRAKRRVVRDLRSSVEQSDTLRSSLQASLGRLPAALQNVAAHLRDKGPDQLGWKDFNHHLVVCPRGLVRQHYTRLVVQDLKDSVELARYEGLPDRFLVRMARQSEDSFFAEAASGSQRVLASAWIVMGVDDDYGWNVGELNGHYYVGGTSQYKADLSEKRQRKELLTKLEPRLEVAKIALGKLKRQEFDEVVSALPAP